MHTYDRANIYAALRDHQRSCRLDGLTSSVGAPEHCSVVRVSDTSAVIGGYNISYSTFQKVYSFVQRQLSSGLMKRLVRYKESNTLLAECTAELSHALGVFGVNRVSVTSLWMLYSLIFLKGAIRDNSNCTHNRHPALCVRKAQGGLRSTRMAGSWHRQTHGNTLL